MKQRFPFFIKALLISGAIYAANAMAADKDADKKVFYRYVNEQGTRVLAQTIPPRFVRNGYEVVSITGEVLSVVPPAPPEADAVRVANERKAAREQARADLQLRRTYSTASEIDAAKTRNLQDLRNNINILQANLLSVRAQLKDQETHAATVERNGKKVSDDVLNNINTLRTEEKDVLAQIKQRELEYQAASDKYDQDKKRFIEITSKP